MLHRGKRDKHEFDYIDRSDLLGAIKAAFSKRDPNYGNIRDNFKRRYNALGAWLANRQRDHHPMPGSAQIALEAKWLLNYRDDWPRLSRRLDDLERSLGVVDQPDRRQDDDGSFGRWCEEHYRRIEPTVDTLQLQDIKPATLKPLKFLERFRDPQELLSYLYRLQISDIETTGKNHRDELGAVQAGLAQLFFKKELREILKLPNLGFAVSPQLEETFIDYLAQTQHRRTGCWGPWYRFGDQLHMVQDLSATFHIIHYREGNVARWPAIIDSMFAMKCLVYPAGWKASDEQQYNNHNNYDVALIFSYGWPKMSQEQKDRATPLLLAMLQWCLNSSITGDGFVGDDGKLDASVDGYYFGVRFLEQIGFWRATAPFWSPREWPLPGAPDRRVLAQRLLDGFMKLEDDTEEGETVISILTAAAKGEPDKA
jgi:hypothetical protein